MNEAGKDEIIEVYHRLGCSYDEILALLAGSHGIIVSKRTLHRILRRMGCYRRRQYSDILEVAIYIQEQLDCFGSLNGYRLMHQKCVQEGFTISREDVRLLLTCLDSIGVSQRKRHRLVRREYHSMGPNYIWHVDSYDKLKPYGLCVNGCIDGFSRHIIWLEVFKTNSDPKIVAGYFMKAVKDRLGCPIKIRGDMGTENGHVAAMQTSLRGEDSFIYGTSQCNQKIESWWSIFRKQCAQFWMSLLSNLKEEESFNGGYLDKSLVQFCFMKLFQNNMDDMVHKWNTHLIRPDRNRQCPYGRPLTMYTLPQVYDTRDYIHSLDHHQIEVCEEECDFRCDIPCDPDIFEICITYMGENNWKSPEDAYEAATLYSQLRERLLVDL